MTKENSEVIFDCEFVAGLGIFIALKCVKSQNQLPFHDFVATTFLYYDFVAGEPLPASAFRQL